MAFYGESYRIIFATNIAGSAITDDGLATIRYHFDGTSDTVTSGDSFIASSELDNLNLTDTDEAVVSWVVETGPASSGCASRCSSRISRPGSPTEASTGCGPPRSAPTCRSRCSAPASCR